MLWHLLTCTFLRSKEESPTSLYVAENWKCNYKISRGYNSVIKWVGNRRKKEMFVLLL
jgi:hypothetical protein